MINIVPLVKPNTADHALSYQQETFNRMIKDFYLRQTIVCVIDIVLNSPQ